MLYRAILLTLLLFDSSQCSLKILPNALIQRDRLLQSFINAAAQGPISSCGAAYVFDSNSKVSVVNLHEPAIVLSYNSSEKWTLDQTNKNGRGCMTFILMPTSRNTLNEILDSLLDEEILKAEDALMFFEAPSTSVRLNHSILDEILNVFYVKLKPGVHSVDIGIRCIYCSPVNYYYFCSWTKNKGFWSKDFLKRTEFTSLFHQVNTWNWFSKYVADYQGKLFRFASNFYNVWSNPCPTDNCGETGMYEGGTEINMILFLASLYNFKYDIKPPPDELWGSLENGSWKGMMGQLIEDRIDIATNLLMTYDRCHAARCSKAYMFESIAAATQPPKPYPLWQAIIRSYSVPVWIALLLTMFAATVAFIFIARAEIRANPLLGRSSDEKMGRPSRALMNYVISSLVLQTPHLVAVRDAMKVLAASWLIFSIVIAYGYTSMLITHYTVPAYKKQLTTLKELVESDYVIKKVYYGDGYDEILKHAAQEESTLLGEMSRSIQHIDYTFTGWPQYAIAEIEENDIALLDTLSDLGRFAISNNIYVTKIKLLSIPGTWCSKKSQFHHLSMDRGIQMAVEHGFWDLWWDTERMKTVREETPGKSIYEIFLTSEKKSSPAASLSIDHIQSIFMALCIGLTFASVVFIIELFQPSCKK